MIDDRMIARFNKLIERIKIYYPGVNEERIRRAFEVASLAHEGQSRKSGDPFLIHPLAVAEILCDMEFDSDSIIVALLHDTIEDTNMSYEDISGQFGTEVADIVDGLTKLNNLPFTSKEEQKLENFRKMFFAMTKDIRVIIIKLADRLHNMRTVAYLSENKRREMSLETMEVYAPIAHRLGIDTIKNELEDLCLKYLDPIAYQEIVDNLSKNSRERERFIENVLEHMRARFADVGMNPHVEGRVKHIYSIYRKMFGQHRNFNEIYDIYAIRVIVNTQAECYNVLGMIHDLYKPIPGRFKDYIGTPKPNMYQSLHTTVIGREGTPFEVQIRTWEMHHINEYGIAAHWKYKIGIIGAQTSLDEKLAWVRQMLETQQDSDPEDFFSSLKVDMFADEVFVFTPKGDVIGLPFGATPIDFAYTIHSEIGNHMVGAKVNARIVPIDTALQNGDIVEVLTLKSSRGPSRDWLSIAKTNEARNKIRQWFKRERREENISEGREMLERELRKNLIPMEALREEYISPILKKLSFPTIEDFYASIGYGGITVNRAVNRIKDEYLRRHKQVRPLFTELIEHEKSQIRPVKSQSGVIVEGISNCLVKFARCCEPVPGDALIGFVTRGYGVSVHRADCANVELSLTSNPTDRDRWLQVCWADEVKGVFLASLQLIAKERVNLLADVAGILANLKINIRSLNSKENGDGFVIIQITFDTQNVEYLNNVIVKLRGIPGVVEIARKHQ